MKTKRKAGPHECRKFVPASIRSVSEDTVEVILSTSDLARDGHILEPKGCVADNYRANPIVLWQHDPDQPVGNCEELIIGSDDIRATIRFAPAGVSAKADEVRGLVKSGVVRTMSIGFDWDMENATPLDPKRPRGGQRIHIWEILESSFVTVPADPRAVVTARAKQEKSMKAKKPARAIVAGYKRLLNVGHRGLYSVGSLAYLISCIGSEAHCAQFEAALEGDDSEVPGMIVDGIKLLGEALVAMTEEEIAELIADLEEAEDEEEGEETVEMDRAFIAAGSNARVRKFRAAIVRAGKSLSKANAGALEEVGQAHTRAMKHHKALGEHNATMGEHVDTMSACAEGMRSAMEGCTRALDAAAENPEKAGDHVEKARKHVEKANGHLDKHDGAAANAKDTGEDMHDSHAALGRSIKSAQRALESVPGNNKDAEDEDGDSKDVQKPEGDEEDKGSRDADLRRRQAQALALSAD